MSDIDSTLPVAEGFVHLHLHTEYSLLDGAIRIKDLPDRLIEMGMNSCAITDHGVMYGVVDFYKKMRAKGLRPIIGCEVYVSPDSRFNREYNPNERAYNHLILLAKNNEGLVNLNRLCSAGFTEGFYRKPRIDHELLERWHEGLICLSACVSGEVAQAILDNNFDKARESITWYDNLFGRGNYYLEIQSNVMREQALVNSALIRISRETGIPLVATNDCHYLKNEDAEVHDVLLCMQTGAKQADRDRMRMSTSDFYVKSETEMRRFFSEVSEAISNTVKIANMCSVEYDFDTIHLPEFDTPDGYDSNIDYLRSLAYEGIRAKIGIVDSVDEQALQLDDHYMEYINRIDYELDVISSMGYTDYYLIVWDFIFFARSKGIMVGPGRGSGAGSLVAYAIGITNIDPIRYGLVFERFLNRERVSMPDFDIDFCYERRQEVIDYVTLKYGMDRVAQVITYGTLQPRLCIRDVARVMDLPYATADKIAKLVPADIGITIDKALATNKELSDEYNNDENVKKIIDYSRKLEGMPRHTSTHAAGVIISGKPITDIAPLSVNDNSVVVQFAKYDVESIGLLKFDFLGLRTLTVMRDAADMVFENYGISIDYDKIPLDETVVFDMIGEGDTVGIFQLESRGMTSFMRDLKPSSLEDIIAGISLYRPGPMDQIPKYIASKHDANSITYDHPLLEPILDVTYGCMVYQEQVMQIVRDLAGFSMGQSDNIRRAMSKKNKMLMERYRRIFIYGGEDDSGKTVSGAIAHGVPESVADKIFNDVSNFAGYAFNKSHAACYALVAYFTAYLKYHYPTEFMAAMMNSYRSNLGAAAWYITCCSSMGIQVLPPDVNKSKARFCTEKLADGSQGIRIGLSIVKNVGENAIEMLVKERESGGKFKDFTDFLSRAGSCGLHKKMIESLIYASALDFTGLTRSSMIMAVQTELDKLNRNHSNEMVGQISLFGDELGEQSLDLAPSIEITNIEEYPMSERLMYEKDVLGIYISGHPLNSYARYIEQHVDFSMKDVKELKDSELLNTINDDKTVVMGGLLLKKTTRLTKAKQQMAILEFEDLYGQFECVIFGKLFDKYYQALELNRAYLIVGKRRIRDEEEFSLFVDKIERMPNEGSRSSIDQFERVVSEDNCSNTLYIQYLGQYGSKSFNRLLYFLSLLNEEETDCKRVKIFVRDSNELIDVDRSCFVSSDSETLEYLKSVCGEDNLLISHSL